MDNLYSMRCTMALNPVTSVSSYRHGEQVRIDVANSGEPIPAAEKYDIRAFYRSHQRKGPLRAVDWG